MGNESREIIGTDKGNASNIYTRGPPGLSICVKMSRTKTFFQVDKRIIEELIQFPGLEPRTSQALRGFSFPSPILIMITRNIVGWLMFHFLNQPLGPYDHCEDVNCYRKGSFCPVHLGERLDNDTYTVVYKLGHGFFSTVWLARDNRHVPDSEDHPYRYVALKLVSAQFSDEAREEISIMQHLGNSSSSDQLSKLRYSILPLIRSFSHESVNGMHTVLVTPVMRRLTELGHVGTNVPLYLTNMACQLFGAVAFLHSKGVVHGDLTIKNAGYLCANITDDEVAHLPTPTLNAVVLWRYNSEPTSAGNIFSENWVGRNNMTTRGETNVRPVHPEVENGLPKYLVSSETWQSSRHLFRSNRVEPCICIADFGSSYKLDQSGRPKVCAPGIYRAPEYLLHLHKLGEAAPATNDGRAQPRHYGDCVASIGSNEEKVDVWQLGCLLYEFFHGHMPLSVLGPRPVGGEELIQLDSIVPEDWKALPSLKAALDKHHSSLGNMNAKFWRDLAWNIRDVSQGRAREVYKDNREWGDGRMPYPRFKAKDYQDLANLIKNVLRLDPRIRPNALDAYEELKAVCQDFSVKPDKQYLGDDEFV